MGGFRYKSTMEKNFKLLIEYDGSAYHGWQRQSNDHTIQETIEKSLAKMVGRPVTLTGSGRTDAGAHALAQAASFKCDTTLTPQAFLGGLNSLLPSDIVIKACLPVTADFHARYSAKSKTYLYRIRNRPLPKAICRQYAWWVKRPLDFNAMASAAGRFTGTHDFSAFEGAGSPRAHTTRTVSEALLRKEDGDIVAFRIRANGFLRFMVRNIVGTLVDVGLGKIAADDVGRILLSKDRAQAGATAPAHGLFLVKVDY